MIESEIKKEHLIKLESYRMADLLFTYGSGDRNKILKAVAKPVNKEMWYEVYYDKECILSTTELIEAIEKYNQL